MRIGLVGFGRFGAALARLCLEAGHEVRAYDPHSPVPGELAAPSLSALTSACELVVLAVPVSELRPILTELRTLARADQLILDVGSVKVAPVALMSDLLGDQVKWVGSHPLFGPASLSRAERPLRVVVCPNPTQPESTKRAEQFFASLGCEVLCQSPEVHDRAMAQTHALTFFIAKALVDLGIGENLAFTPPSFQAIARTIELVRVDAGHLLTAVAVLNPFAREVRESFLAALKSSHEALTHFDAAVETPGSLEIPPLEAQSQDLREAREQIDELDHELVRLLQRRAELARRAGRAKRELGHPIQDPSREAKLLSTRREWARAAGLDEAQLEAVFREILTLSRRTQAER